MSFDCALSHHDRCKFLVSAVENLSTMEKEELFKIIHKTQTNYTRNNNGVFINLAWLPVNILEDLEGYVQFCKNSEKVLHKYESICDLLNSKLVHTKSIEVTAAAAGKTSIGKEKDKDKVQNCEIDSGTDIEAVTEGGAVKERSSHSSSMRYTIYKKRFAKQAAVSQYENDLRLEPYIHIQ